MHVEVTAAGAVRGATDFRAVRLNAVIRVTVARAVTVNGACTVITPVMARAVTANMAITA